MNKNYIQKAKGSIKLGKSGNSKPILIILMGLPGTGKSYLANYLNEKYSFTILSGENVTHSIFGTEKCSGKQYKEAYEVLRFIATDLLNQGYNIVIDGTNLKYIFREQIYESIDKSVERTLFYLYTDDELALKRANSRGEDYADSKNILSRCSPETFADFKTQLEEPRGDENFYKIKSDEDLFERVDDIMDRIIKE